MKSAVLVVLCLAGSARASECAPVRIQVFGDSTAVGYDSFTKTTASPSPGQALQRALDDRLGAGAARVEVRAVGGTDSAQLLAGTDGLNLPWPRSVDADIVVINHAINDWSHGRDPAHYAENLRRLAASPARVVVFETQVSRPNNPWRVPLTYGETMRAVARENRAPIADAEAYVHGLPDGPSYFADDAHPNASLYGRIARDVLAPTLAPIVKAFGCRVIPRL